MVRGLSWNVNVRYGSFELSCIKTNPKEVPMNNNSLASIDSPVVAPSFPEAANRIS